VNASERIVAILYWGEAQPAELGEPGGEPIVSEPSWFVVLADDPMNHFSIEAPSIEGLDNYEELVEATEAAFDAASRVVADALNSGRLI
jgi:hypothetical protein